MIQNGASLSLVQKQLGHASVVTTQRYSHLYPSQTAELFDRMNVRYQSVSGVGESHSRSDDRLTKKKNPRSGRGSGSGQGRRRSVDLWFFRLIWPDAVTRRNDEIGELTRGFTSPLLMVVLQRFPTKRVLCASWTGVRTGQAR